MNKLKALFAGFAIAAVAVVGIGVKQAQAQEAVPNYSCDVTVVDGSSNNGLKVSADKKSISTKLKVTGSNANCDRYATIAVWKSDTANGQPLSQQKFFGHVTKKLSVGDHTLTTQLPECSFWQADLLGQARPKSINGDANYQYPQDILVNFKLGGKKCDTPPPPTVDVCPNIPGDQATIPADMVKDADGNCVVPTEPTDVCPNIDGMQTEVPDGYTRDADGNCVITPENPVVPAGTTVAEELPDTGAGAFAAIASSVTALGSGVAHFVIRRKKLLV